MSDKVDMSAFLAKAEHSELVSCIAYAFDYLSEPKFFIKSYLKESDTERKLFSILSFVTFEMGLRHTTTVKQNGFLGLMYARNMAQEVITIQDVISQLDKMHKGLFNNDESLRRIGVEAAKCYVEKFKDNQSSSDADKAAADALDLIEELVKRNSAPAILQRSADVMKDRSDQYDNDDGVERSMSKAVAAFNGVTGRDLSVSEGFILMMQLKLVRAISARREDSFEDSVLDLTAYAALYGEALMEEKV